MESNSILDHRGLWQAVLGELEINVSRASFSTWFKHTAIIAEEDGHIVVAVPNIFTKEWLEKKYGADIKSALARMNPGVETVEYKVTSSGTSAAPAKDPLNAAASPIVQTQPVVTSSIASPRAGSLNPKYTFDTFVVGASNELAYAACQAVAKSPGAKYNPLFIYGGVGLGKTHLMQAVGNEILRRDPSKRIEYVTSEGFTNEFVSHISRKKSSSFSEKYRSVDVLIIDDMQFLAGKEKTQEEFFHTFNDLHQANKQVIISSDKPPKAIPHLEERLRSRFEWGMTADIQSPDLETRSAILQAKAASQGVLLTTEVIDYLARHFQSNIRELEGALTQLMAYCELRGTDPSIATVTSLLGNIAASGPRRKAPTPKLIIEKTAAYFDITPDEITGAKRDKDIVVPRQIAMYIMRHELGLSFPKIASCVGGRDHTTAMHSVGKIEKLLEVDEDLRGEVNRVKERIIL